MTRTVVIGHGMVGSRFAEDLVAADPEAQVTVLGKEKVPAYNRVLLSDVVAGSTRSDVLGLAGPDSDRLQVHTGVAATGIDRTTRVVTDSAGAEHAYDTLVLATGSAARIPPIQGVATSAGLLDGVFVLRDLADATGIVEQTRTARNAVVLGAGVLGIEVAQSSLERLGILTHVEASVVGVTSRRGRITGLRLSTGSEIATDLLVLCTGTSPETVLAQRADLPCERGVLVDEASGTSDPHVYAIGDCAQPPEGSSGLVAQGWEQATRLVARLTGRGSSPAEQADTPVPPDVVRVKASGMPMVSMGLNGDFDRGDPRFRTLTLKDRDGGRFVELVLHEERLLGATCVGDADVGATLSALYTRGAPVPSDPAQLMVRALAGGTAAAVTDPAELDDTDRVCTCNSVPAGRIRDAIRGGCGSVAQVADATRAGTGCGDCRSTISALLEADLTPTADTTDRPTPDMLRISR